MTCITLPQDTLFFCKALRKTRLELQQKFYRLTSPQEHLKKYPSETTNVLEAVAFPLLNQTSAKVVARSVLSPTLHETDWVLHYIGMSLKNKLISSKSLTPGFLKAFTSYSDFANLLDVYRERQQDPLLGFANMEKYLKYPSQELPFKDIIAGDVWQQDDVFVQQRLAGLNPMSLRQLSLEDEVNARFINKDFDWNSAIKKASGEETDFDEMVKKGFVFVIDYWLIHNITNVADIGDIFPSDRREMRASRSPIGVFVSAKGKSGGRSLKPVAIQIDLNSSAPVRSPSDGAKWLLAKEEIQRADITHAELIEHLLKTHLLMEPICVLMRRSLSSYHPIHQIFKWHCRGLFVTNSLGLPALVDPYALLHILFAIGHTGGVELLNKGYQYLSWADTDFKNNLEKRGVHELDKLPYFPYRDDGLLIWDEIGDFATEYINLYYKNDKSVSNDYELQNFANELSDKGVGPNGGLGKFKGFPATILTKQEVVDIVKRIVFIPIQHHAVNYPVAYYGAFVPNMPTKLYDDPRVPAGEFGFHSLPQANIATYQTSLSMSLGSLRYDKFFDYKLKDDRANEVVSKYNKRLMEDINEKISDANNKRLKLGFLSYPYFLPPWMPNSIHT